MVEGPFGNVKVDGPFGEDTIILEGKIKGRGIWENDAFEIEDEMRRNTTDQTRTDVKFTRDNTMVVKITGSNAPLLDIEEIINIMRNQSPTGELDTKRSVITA